MSQVFDAIANTVTIAAGSADMAKHLNGFVRVNRGSYVEGLNDLDSTLKFLYNLSARFEEVPHSEVNAECPGAARVPARYFRASVPTEYSAYENIVTVRDLVGEGQLENIRIREGAHGLEFFVPQEAECEIGSKRTDNVWIILGPSEEGEVVWTWYPGRMTAGSPLDNHAVKLSS
jgi:hypothetical protein